MNVTDAFGVVLKKYRKLANLSQEQLALQCNLDRTYIGMLERGQRQPTITTLFTIADTLSIEPNKLVKEIEALL
ncbi:helix-turn-helix domain-containing protein [Ureibacillus chungkukjangi]|uniref:Helix-turn-helix protein n=1 Tax=Ureibacillus chungkukjangi TaxID=1202712 RepID=A0A318TWV8_9BACL|nr:helix-turn-helix transcriptional regulator [Ureibacillus chungkukjangi]PYF08237.1 helix-turn-helix protein [Ureibacillus chungkukjangi]